MSPPIDESGIFSRVDKAIKECVSSKVSGHGYQAEATALFLGDAEWNELLVLCAKWGHTWPTTSPYPHRPEIKQRAQFKGLPIFRVDAAAFLEVH